MSPATKWIGAVTQCDKSTRSEYRKPLLLQVVGGFSGKEIAEIPELNNNTVMIRSFRTRGKLKSEFGLSTEVDEES